MVTPQEWRNSALTGNIWTNGTPDTWTGASGASGASVSKWVDCNTTTSTFWIRYCDTSTCDASSAYYTWAQFPVPAEPATDRMRTIIRSRLAPNIITRRKHMRDVTNAQEFRARETLCRVLGSDGFRRFLKNGFVSVRAKSGLVYQIFPGNNITKVYKHGKLIERLCVVMDGRFPPTDSLIMRYLLILNDEADFRSYAIRHSVPSMTLAASTPPAQQSLVDIWAKIKAA